MTSHLHDALPHRQTARGRHVDPADDPVVVRGPDVDVHRRDVDLPLAEVRHRYGGVDPLAVVMGALAGLGALAVLGAIAAAAGSPFRDRDDERVLSIVALAVSLAVLALAFFVAGHTAGRAARYEGGRNGLLTALLLLLLIAGLAGGASAFDAVRDQDRPSWVDPDLGIAALIATAGALVLALALATIGGRAGGHWHHRVDQRLLRTRAGGVGGAYGIDHDHRVAVERTAGADAIDGIDGTAR